MAKSQKHSNREAKKPKQVKVPAPLDSASLLTRNQAGQPKKKG